MRIATGKNEQTNAVGGARFLPPQKRENAMSPAEALLLAINYVMRAHDTKPVEPRKATRKWDGHTPYGIHPIWCATSILHETRLTEDIRILGCYTLLFHDILEDTTAGLPSEMKASIKTAVRDMTFASTEEEMRLVWERSPFIRMLKLYDKVSNLMDGAWMTDKQRRTYENYTRQLADDAERRYGELRIVKIARALIA